MKEFIFSEFICNFILMCHKIIYHSEVINNQTLCIFGPNLEKKNDVKILHSKWIIKDFHMKWMFDMQVIISYN